MAKQFRDLVGRAMIDPEFVAELQRSPAEALAGYDLTDDERALVEQALVRLAKAPAPQRADELKSALLRRVAT